MDVVHADMTKASPSVLNDQSNNVSPTLNSAITTKAFPPLCLGIMLRIVQPLSSCLQLAQLAARNAPVRPLARPAPRASRCQDPAAPRCHSRPSRTSAITITSTRIPIRASQRPNPQVQSSPRQPRAPRLHSPPRSTAISNLSPRRRRVLQCLRRWQPPTTTSQQPQLPMFQRALARSRSPTLARLPPRNPATERLQLKMILTLGLDIDHS